MNMSINALDPFKFQRKLEASSAFTPEQIQSLSDAVNDAQAESSLATKQDLQLVQMGLRMDIESVKSDFKVRDY